MVIMTHGLYNSSAILFYLYEDILLFQVSWTFETGAVSQDVCLSVRFRLANFLRQAL